MSAVIVLGLAEMLTYVVLFVGAVTLVVWKRDKIIDRIVGNIDHNPDWDDDE
jgi:hypothetical protein